jgi:putative transposase
MPRIARVVVPDAPHHVTQRGNRREDVFFCEADRHVYLRYLADYAGKHGLKILAYCLMTNHVHLVVVPRHEASLAGALKPVHLRYAQHVNWTQQLCGRLWQGRFYSCPMDEAHLYAAVRYVERNPVRAGMVACAEEYPWSSAASHCGLRNDPFLADPFDMASAIEHWTDWLREPEDSATLTSLRNHTHTGRPLGNELFTAALEKRLSRILRPKPPGRPKKEGAKEKKYG